MMDMIEVKKIGSLPIGENSTTTLSTNSVSTDTESSDDNSDCDDGKFDDEVRMLMKRWTKYTPYNP